MRLELSHRRGRSALVLSTLGDSGSECSCCRWNWKRGPGSLLRGSGTFALARVAFPDFAQTRGPPCAKRPVLRRCLFRSSHASDARRASLANLSPAETNPVWGVVAQVPAGVDRVPDNAIGDNVGRFTDDRFSCVVDPTGAPELRVIDQHFDLLRDAFVYCDCRARAVLLKVVAVENGIPVVERHRRPFNFHAPPLALLRRAAVRRSSKRASTSARGMGVRGSFKASCTLARNQAS